MVYLASRILEILLYMQAHFSSSETSNANISDSQDLHLNITSGISVLHNMAVAGGLRAGSKVSLLLRPDLTALKLERAR